MKTEQNNEMSRRSFLKQTVLAGTAICVTPTLEKVTAAERAIAGKSSTSVTTFPASMAERQHLLYPQWDMVAWD